MSKIKYTEVKHAPRPTFRTVKYGNILADTVQGEVHQDTDDGTWSGWMTNYSNSRRTSFKLGMGSKSAATRWVNSQLREHGVK